MLSVRWASKAGVALGLVIGGPVVLAQGPPPAMVRFDPARVEVIPQQREVTGELRSARRSMVASQEAGLLVEFDVEVGDWLDGGQVVARLDDVRLSLEKARLETVLRASEAEIAEEQASLTKAQRDLSRYRELEQRGGARANEVADAETEVTSALARMSRIEAELAGVQAQLDLVEERLADMTIVAPFAGQVVEKSGEVGQWVGAGESVVELVWLEEIDVWVDVPERFVGAVTSDEDGMSVRINATGEVLPLSDAVVVSAGNQLARTFPVRGRIDNASHALRPGMSVVALVPTGQTGESLTIHKDAILRNDAGPFVYFDPGSGVATVAPVTIQFGAGERMAIRSPMLRDGSRVVIEGNERMFPGQPLKEMGAGGGGGRANGAAPPAGGGGSRDSAAGAGGSEGNR